MESKVAAVELLKAMVDDNDEATAEHVSETLAGYPEVRANFLLASKC